MKTAINILEQQYRWVFGNKDVCPHSDDYYEGYKEATFNCLTLLRVADKITETSARKPKSMEIWKWFAEVSANRG